MAEITVAFLGDIYATPGRKVLEQQLPRLRADHHPDVVIANGENAAHGLGLSPRLYRSIRRLGIDAITLGDHVYRAAGIEEILADPDEPAARPANLPRGAIGKRYVELRPSGRRSRRLILITVLGRVFLSIPVDNPLSSIDRLLEELDVDDAIVIVEAHMEATSEKAAIAHHLDGRVAAVIGTHTHVPTADARLLAQGTAFITDIGMCGPYDSCIGRDKESVARYLTTGMYTRFGIASGGEAMCGVVFAVDEHSGLSTRIERVEYRADPEQPPFG
jgi:metallophosphoesterase (TIGR00282 family)